MQPLLPWLAALAAALGGAALAHADGGASTFKAGHQLYRPREWRDDEIPVPKVNVVDSTKAPSVPDTGPGDSELRFPLTGFQVSGNTLLPPSEIDARLAEFKGEKKTIADVQAARDALAKLYEQAGFVTVAVVLPQQTIGEGIVRLDVIEARLGDVKFSNPGVAWFSDASVRRLTPSLRPGALVREQDLSRDLASANRNPDRSVRPVLTRGSTPDTVDLELAVDDRIPLHASTEINNNQTPGSPNYRQDLHVSYGNLWGLEHEITGFYEFTPTSDFSKIQVFSGTYRAPMPWDPDQSLFLYVVKSDSSSVSVGGGGLGILGKGLNYGMRYDAALPRFGAPEWYSHGLTLGVDQKHAENDVTAGTAEIVTPITYLPWSVFYHGSITRPHEITSFRVGSQFQFAGTLPGGDRVNFQENRGGAGPGDPPTVNYKNPVTGNYQIWSLQVQNLIRLPGVLTTLAAGHLVDLPAPDRSFADDWTLSISSFGQYANEPLISTEQYPAGGLGSVRGYLQSEVLGDQAVDFQVEVRTPTLRGLPPGFLGGFAGERLQPFVFYDGARLWQLSTPGVPLATHRLTSFGAGVRAGLFDHVDAEAVVAYPMVETESTNGVRFHFRVSAGF